MTLALPPLRARARDVRPRPHADLGASALFRAYVAREPAALAFYTHDPWDGRARAAAARRAAAHARHRDAVADVLAEQNEAWGADEAVRARVAQLRDPEAVAVVTGQQLGLFAGPLYTVYKALSAVRQAAALAAETGRPVVPVFWLADEDHDYAEVERAVFAGPDGARAVALEAGQLPGAGRAPVGRLVLGAAAARRLLGSLAGALPRGPHRTAALAAAREAYRAGTPLRDAFARLLRALVPGTGLVFISADDVRLKRLAAPLFAREATHWPDTLARLEAASARLEAEGFHAQVAPRPVNLFLFEREGSGTRRTPLDPADPARPDEGFVLRGTTTRLTPEALAQLAAGHPERLSPNVVLRPLVQDTLLPTALYVAGPGEAAYFAQLRPVYEAFGVPMPAIAPRQSLTLIPPAAAKVLARYGLDGPDLRPDPDALHRRLALAAFGQDLDGAFDAARARAEAVVADLARTIAPIDATLARSAAAAEAAVAQAVERLRVRAARAQKRRHADIRARLDRARALLWPCGMLQERALSPLDVAARYGLEALLELLAALPADGREHLDVYL
ncbi:MAG: bacillithiol biosynthesis cysteine-adding enzyme BshC [Rubricoccaceae bacterium]